MWELQVREVYTGCALTDARMKFSVLSWGACFIGNKHNQDLAAFGSDIS